MINTKYEGILTNEEVQDYLKRLVGKVFKLLPIYESEGNEAFLKNHASLMEELLSGERLILKCGLYVELLNKLESITELDTHKKVRKRVLECIDVVKKLQVEVGRWNIGEVIE